MMSVTLSDETLLNALQAWPLSEPSIVQRLPGGFTSEVWLVELGKERFAAKYAYQSQKDFDGGLYAAELFEQHGIINGPLLFDIALSVLWYFPEGSQLYEPFLHAYFAEAPMTAGELAGLPYYKALLWARQAKYFAYRVSANVTLGGSGSVENLKSFTEARQQLEQLLAEFETSS